MKVGLRRGLHLDTDRKAWSGNGPRPVSWVAWYPAAHDAVAVEENADEFISGPIASGADICADKRSYPVILLSHGTGGSALSLSWLALRLAESGYIVIGPNHHGNTTLEPYEPAGFCAWWERARDLTFTLDALSTESFLADRMDMRDVSAVGFSLGGYTVMCLLGAITDFEIFRLWANENGARKGPRELPDLPDLMPSLMKEPIFMESWARQSHSYKDARVRRAILLAPAPPIRAFTPASLASIEEPVTIVVGGDDHEAPADICAEWMKTLIPNSVLHNLGANVGHAAFLCLGTEIGKQRSPELYVDPPGINRAAIHNGVADITLSAAGL